MKVYGYTNSEAATLEELREVSFMTSVQELRGLTTFFNEQAMLFEGDNKKDHVHFSGFVEDKTMKNEIIVCNHFFGIADS